MPLTPMKLMLAVPLIASLAVLFGVARMAGALVPDLHDGFFSGEQVVPALVLLPIAVLLPCIAWPLP